MLAAGEIDAWAANRQRLIEMAASAPNMRVLPDNYFAVQAGDHRSEGRSRGAGCGQSLSQRCAGFRSHQKSDRGAGLKGAVDVAPQ